MKIYYRKYPKKPCPNFLKTILKGHFSNSRNWSWGLVIIIHYEVYLHLVTYTFRVSFAHTL